MCGKVSHSVYYFKVNLLAFIVVCASLELYDIFQWMFLVSNRITFLRFYCVAIRYHLLISVILIWFMLLDS